MAAHSNHAKRQLAAGRLAVGPVLRQSRPVDIGVRFIVAGVDTGFLVTAASARVAFLRELLKG
jgi:2-keto-3-deoxy-L-rhamnonate aldolase RhmA